MSEIVLAQAADCAAVRECVRAAYAHYVARIGREPAPMGADYEALIALGLVYVVRSSVADVLAVLVLRGAEDALWIENIAVQPQVQGQGIGRRLMAFAEERARAAGLGEVRLYTHELMTENIAYYTRLGYVETERRVEDGFRRVFMHKKTTRSFL